MTQIDILLIDLLKIKSQKSFVIKLQQYEKAAMLRDQEKKLCEEMNGLLDPNEIDVDGYRWVEDRIDKYSINKYGVSIYDKNCLTQVIREIKLIELGL